MYILSVKRYEGYKCLGKGKLPSGLLVGRLLGRPGRVARPRKGEIAVEERGGQSKRGEKRR